MNLNINRTFIVSNAGAIPAGSRVKYVGSNQVAVAIGTDAEIGYAQVQSGKSSYAAGTPIGVVLRTPAVLALAVEAFADGASLKRQASGKVGTSGANAACAVALEASAADNDIVEVLPLVSP